MTEFVRMRSRPADDRGRQRVDGRSGDSEAPVALVFALSLFFLVFTLGISQITAQSHAMILVRGAVASLTDLDALVADNGEALRKQAAADPGGSTELTAYPIAVTLENREIASANDAALRELILERAAAQVYVNGPSAFSEGDQDIGTFSSEGLLKFLLGQLTGDLHKIMTWGSVALAALAVALGLHVVRRESGHRKFTMLGIFAAVSALVAIIVSSALGVLISRFGGSDPFSSELRNLILSIVRIWRWDAIVVLTAGLVTVVLGMGYRMATGVVRGQDLSAQSELDYIDYGLD